MLTEATYARENPKRVHYLSMEELQAAPAQQQAPLGLWNAFPAIEQQKKVGDRDMLIDRIWTAIGALPDPDQPI